MPGKFPALLALIFLLAPVPLAGQTPPSDKAPRIEGIVSHYEKLGQFNGAILVADHGNIICAEGVGDANMESHTPNTRFGIASLTKQFTALLVLQQAAEGKILLPGKVSDYLPWYRKDTGSRMTIEQLLHHTSGLPPDFDSPEFSATPAAARRYEHQEFAENFCQPALAYAPGTMWEYSNCGYNLLGPILERVSGMPFDALLGQRILDPLGMKDSGLVRNDLLQLPQLGGATGYLRHAGSRYTIGPYWDRIHGFSSGSLYSTAEDLYKWNQALSSGNFISKDLREQIFSPVLHDWGYGWFITKIPAGQPGAGSTVAEMRGDMPDNFFAWTLRYPERDAVIITLRNVYGSTEGLEQNIQAILFDAVLLLPSRNPKDIAAQICLLPIRWMASHVALAVIFFLFIAITIWFLSRHLQPA